MDDSGTLDDQDVGHPNTELVLEVLAAKAETPHNAALYEAGKALLVDSVTAGRDFCKFMVGVASGAIPAYLTLVGLAIGHRFRPSPTQGVVLLAGPGLFAMAATVFAWALLPIPDEISLDLPQDIERVRVRLVGQRRRATIIGFTVFTAGMLEATGAIAFALLHGTKG